MCGCFEEVQAGQERVGLWGGECGEVGTTKKVKKGEKNFPWSQAVQ